MSKLYVYEYNEVWVLYSVDPEHNVEFYCDKWHEWRPSGMSAEALELSGYYTLEAEF